MIYYQRLAGNNSPGMPTLLYLVLNAKTCSCIAALHFICSYRLTYAVWCGGVPVDIIGAVSAVQYLGADQSVASVTSKNESESWIEQCTNPVSILRDPRVWTRWVSGGSGLSAGSGYQPLPRPACCSCIRILE